MKKLLLIAILLLGNSLFAQVEGKVEVPYIDYKIKMGKGFDTVQANCSMCHSFGYILNMGPQSHEFWNKKVNKMIKHFKAPISKADSKIIKAYLTEYYGNRK